MYHLVSVYHPLPGSTVYGDSGVWGTGVQSLAESLVKSLGISGGMILVTLLLPPTCHFYSEKMRQKSGILKILR